MNFNVTLDKQQIDEIASATADKVLSTNNYHIKSSEMHEREIKQYKTEVQRRDSMLVQKDFVIERLRESLIKVRIELKEYKKQGE